MGKAHLLRNKTVNVLRRVIASRRKLLAEGWRALRSGKLRRVVARSGIFDELWYASRYPDLARSGIDPISHYLRFGAREGRDPFRDLSLPQAVLKLRQGGGRLIRTKEDHGIVILTDQRVVSRSYGARFIESFPVPADRFEDESALVREVAGWFERES